MAGRKSGAGLASSNAASRGSSRKPTKQSTTPAPKQGAKNGGKTGSRNGGKAVCGAGGSAPASGSHSGSAAPNPDHADCPDADINIAVMRLFRTTLSGFSKSELRQLQGKRTGKSVHKYLYDGISSLKGTNRYLSTRFWTKFYEEFGLGSSLFQGVRDLGSEGANPRQDLLEALVGTRADNPLQRTTVPFKKFLEGDDGEITQDELVLIFSSMTPSERVTQSMSDDMLGPMLKYMGQYDMAKKYPTVWEAVREDCDAFVARKWSAAVSKNQDRGIWVTGHRFMLSKFMNIDGAKQTIKAASGEGAEIDRALLGRLLQSKIGEALFKSEALDWAFANFRETGSKAVHNVEMHDFSPETVSDFKGLMKNQIQLLVSAGQQPMVKKQECPENKS